MIPAPFVYPTWIPTQTADTLGSIPAALLTLLADATLYDKNALDRFYFIH